MATLPQPPLLVAQRLLIATHVKVASKPFGVHVYRAAGEQEVEVQGLAERKSLSLITVAFNSLYPLRICNNRTWRRPVDGNRDCCGGKWDASNRCGS